MQTEFLQIENTRAEMALKEVLKWKTQVPKVNPYFAFLYDIYFHDWI